jgi:hypothetical protein
MKAFKLLNNTQFTDRRHSGKELTSILSALRAGMLATWEWNSASENTSIG